MIEKTISPDFELLSSAAKFIKPEFKKNESLWIDSPFEWVLTLPSASKGKLGKRLVYQWCALKGLSIDSSPDSQADMLINGHRVEIKFSTLWENGIYKSKQILKNHVIGHMGQHTGSTGQETAWFPVIPQSVPDWLAPCGGTLDQAYK